MNYKEFLVLACIVFVIIGLLVSSQTDWGISSKVVNGKRKYYQKGYVSWKEQDYSPSILAIAIIIAILIGVGYYFFKIK